MDFPLHATDTYGYPSKLKAYHLTPFFVDSSRKIRLLYSELGGGSVFGDHHVPASLVLDRPAPKFRLGQVFSDQVRYPAIAEPGT